MTSVPEPRFLNPCSFLDDDYVEDESCVLCAKKCRLTKDPKNPKRWRPAYRLQCVAKLLKQAREGNSDFDRVLQFRLSYVTDCITRLVHDDCRVKYYSKKFRPGPLPPYSTVCNKKDCEHHKYDLDLETASGSCFGDCPSKYCRVKRLPVLCNPFDSGDCDSCAWPKQCRMGLETPPSPTCCAPSGFDDCPDSVLLENEAELSKLLSKGRAARFGRRVRRLQPPPSKRAKKRAK